MKNRALKVFVLLILSSLSSCGQDDKGGLTEDALDVDQKEGMVQIVPTQPHSYGGWYCPDNLTNFPAVDIANWKNVPVVNNRMATEEEAQNGTSLIFVDAEKYPNAKALDITMPKLAQFYCESTQREEFIIVIQAINVSNDSIVGFRYLNGGNGSARLNEVSFLSDTEIKMIPKTRFVSQIIEIAANQAEIWDVLTKPEYAEKLRPYFDADKKLKADWRETSNVNYHYQNTGAETAAYGGKLYGCFYVQNDYEKLGYTEKFFLLEDKETGITELKIVCGPFVDDFESQKSIINNWSQKVKDLSEK